MWRNLQVWAWTKSAACAALIRFLSWAVSRGFFINMTSKSFDLQQKTPFSVDHKVSICWCLQLHWYSLMMLEPVFGLYYLSVLWYQSAIYIMRLLHFFDRSRVWEDEDICIFPTIWVYMPSKTLHTYALTLITFRIYEDCLPTKFQYLTRITIWSVE